MHSDYYGHMISVSQKPRQHDTELQYSELRASSCHDQIDEKFLNTQPVYIKPNAAFAYIVLYATLYIYPKPYFDWAKEFCNVYAMFTLHEVKSTCASKISLPHAAAPRTNQGLSIHQRINCPLYLC